MVRDVVDLDRAGHLGESLARRRLLSQQRTHGVGDLLAPSVADGDVHLHPLHVGGFRFGRFHAGDERLGKHLQVADRLQAPRVSGGQALNRRGDDLQKRVDLFARPLEIVRRQQPQRDQLDADLVAPREELVDLVGAAPVTERGVAPQLFRPPPISVEHDADMTRQISRPQPAHEPALIQSVQQCRRGHLQPPIDSVRLA